MRLPSDAVLLAIDMQQANEPSGEASPDEAAARVATLLAAWRGLALPLVHLRRDAPEPGAACRAGEPGFAFCPAATPRPGEPIVDRSTAGAFADGRLDGALTRIGVTTLVLCGRRAETAVAATARGALDLGYRVFVVGDACRAAAAVDLAGGRWSAADVHALSLAGLAGAGARIVDAARAVEAARLAAAIRDRRLAQGR